MIYDGKWVGTFGDILVEILGGSNLIYVNSCVTRIWGVELKWYNTDSETSLFSHIWSISINFLEVIEARKAKLIIILIILSQIPL